MNLAYPLTWPTGWPRTRHPQRALFRTSFSAARDDLTHELDLLGAKNIIISSNVPLRMDGIPRAGAKEPEDSGIAVYFTLDGEPKVIPVDKWNRVMDNLRAAQKTVAALRGIERWGAKSILAAAFQGFAALPENAQAAGDGWWLVLGVDRSATPDEITRAFRRRSMETHPDVGGTKEAFYRIQAAYEAAVQEVTSR